MYRDIPTDEEVRISMNLSPAEFYDNPDLSWLTPSEEEAEDIAFIRKYFPQEEE